jgi:hypothetical protein
VRGKQCDEDTAFIPKGTDRKKVCLKRQPCPESLSKPTMATTASSKWEGLASGTEGFREDKRNIFRKTLKFQHLGLRTETIMV